MIRIKTQKVLRNLGNIFKMNTFLTVSPRAVFRTQLKAFGGAFLQKLLTNFSCNFFAKNPHRKC